MAAGVAGWAVWTLQDMPAMADLNTEKRPATVTYLDRHGREIGVRGSRGSRPVSLAMVADSLPVAVLAVEDRRSDRQSNPAPQKPGSAARLMAGA